MFGVSGRCDLSTGEGVCLRHVSECVCAQVCLAPQGHTCTCVVSVPTQGPRRGAASTARQAESWNCISAGLRGREPVALCCSGGSGGGWGERGGKGGGTVALLLGPTLSHGKGPMKKLRPHREERGHKNLRSQHGDFHFPSAAFQETVPPKGCLKMLSQRSNPTRLACEGLHPGQRRDFNGQNTRLSVSSFPQGTQLFRTLHPGRWTDKESGQ